MAVSRVNRPQLGLGRARLWPGLGAIKAPPRRHRPCKRRRAVRHRDGGPIGPVHQIGRNLNHEVRSGSSLQDTLELPLPKPRRLEAFDSDHRADKNTRGNKVRCGSNCCRAGGVEIVRRGRDRRIRQSMQADPEYAAGRHRRHREDVSHQSTRVHEDHRSLAMADCDHQEARQTAQNRLFARNRTPAHLVPPVNGQDVGRPDRLAWTSGTSRQPSAGGSDFGAWPDAAGRGRLPA